jgi:hypothetical protein
MIGEPTITINGKLLTVGQAMTVRVAIQSFAVSLNSEGLEENDEDEIGKSITKGYLGRISEINDMIIAP